MMNAAIRDRSYPMDQKKPPEYILDVFADPTLVKDVVKSVLHMILFHRYFHCVRPSTVEILDLTLPAIRDAELETLIDSRVTTFIRQLSSSNSPNGGVRGQIAVKFFERKRRRTGMWFGGLGGKGEEDICWEIWSVNVTIATPRTEAERYKVRNATEMMLQKTALRIITFVNKEKDHIPIMNLSDANPFPYQIVLNPKMDSWSDRHGLY